MNKHVYNLYIYIYIYMYIYMYIHGVITTEGFFEVAIESLPEWDLNPWPLNSVQIYPISSLPLSFQMFDSSDYFKNVEISKGHSISYSKETKYKKKNHCVVLKVLLQESYLMQLFSIFAWIFDMNSILNVSIYFLLLSFYSEQTTWLCFQTFNNRLQTTNP